MAGNKPKRETLVWIKYLTSQTERLAYWLDRGAFGSGFYTVTELNTPESELRQVFRIEPSVYVTPELWQYAQGEYGIEIIDKL